MIAGKVGKTWKLHKESLIDEQKYCQVLMKVEMRLDDTNLQQVQPASIVYHLFPRKMSLSSKNEGYNL